MDGVLTDGRIYLSEAGREFKVFDTKDGHGMRKALARGLKIAWISGRRSAAVARRARELGVRHCRQGVSDKLTVYRELCRLWSLSPEETAALGDDEPDAPMLAAAGFSACPADAMPEARAAADAVLQRPGGRGAAREFIERVLALKASGSPARSARKARPARSRARRRAASRRGHRES